MKLIQFTVLWFLIHVVILVLCRLFPKKTTWIEIRKDGSRVQYTNRKYMMGSVPRVITTLITLAIWRILC